MTNLYIDYENDDSYMVKVAKTTKLTATCLLFAGLFTVIAALGSLMLV